MVTEIIQVFYDELGLKQREHICYQEWVSESAKLSDSERERRKQDLNNLMPDSLKKALSGWKHDNMYALQAIRITPDKQSDGHIRIYLKKAGQPMSVTLPYAERDITKLEARNQTKWTSSVISDKISFIDEDGLDDFLHCTKSATFGFFKVNSPQLYFLQLIS